MGVCEFFLRQAFWRILNTLIVACPDYLKFEAKHNRAVDLDLVVGSALETLAT